MAKAKLPDASVIYNLLENGETVKSVAAAYDVQVASVNRKMARAGYNSELVGLRYLVPWEIEERHRNTSVAQNIRTIARIGERKVVDPRLEGLATRWIHRLLQYGLVVGYDPDVGPNEASTLGGFYYDHRLPTDSDWFRP